MGQLQFFEDQPTAAAVAAIEGQPGDAIQGGPVGFVYRMPGKPIAWLTEAAVLAHVRRWQRPPAVIRVSTGHVEAARHCLDGLGFPQVAVIGNGGTLACEVETWNGGAG